MQGYFGITTALAEKLQILATVFSRYEKRCSCWWIYGLNVEMQSSQINQQNRNSLCFTQAKDKISLTHIA